MNFYENVLLVIIAYYIGTQISKMYYEFKTPPPDQNEEQPIDLTELFNQLEKEQK